MSEALLGGLPPLFEEIRNAIPESTRDHVWLVGGAVRDVLMRRPVRDLDFVVDGDALRVARAVANGVGGGYYVLDAERATGRAVVQRDGLRYHVDFARLRGARLLDDLLARDFTIDAMAVPIVAGGQIVDPTGGETDLRRRTVRATSETAFRDDPVRTVRAIRIAADLDFHVERESRELIRAAAPALASVSAERVRDELMHCLGGPRPARSVRALDLLGLLQACVPEASGMKGQALPPHGHDAWEHTLAVLDRLAGVLSVLQRRHDVDAASEFALGLVASRVGRYREQICSRMEAELSVGRTRRALLFLTALLHETAPVGGRGDVGEGGVVEQRCRALRLSNTEIGWVAQVAQQHRLLLQLPQDAPLPPRDVHRFFRQTGDVGVEACLLALADVLAAWGSELPQSDWANLIDRTVDLLDAYFYRYTEVVAPPPLLNGDDLIAEIGLAPGPQLGALLQAIREEQAAGEVKARGEALEFARRRLQSAG